MPLACGRAVLVTVVNLAACETLECGRVRDGRSNLSTPTLGKIGKDGEDRMPVQWRGGRQLQGVRGTRYTVTAQAEGRHG